MRVAFRCSLVVLIAAWSACARSQLEGETAVAGSSGATTTTGEHDLSGASGERGHQSSGGGVASGSSTPDGPDATTSPSGDGATGAAADAANEATGTVGGTEVWVGQLWSIAPALCDPDVPQGVNPMQHTGYTERVVLILEPGDDPARPSGRIALGQGVVPDDPGDAPYTMNGNGTFWLCSMQSPAKGGEYRVLEARRSAQRITFEIEPGEIWKPCAGDSPECRPPCDGVICFAVVGERDYFDLLVNGDTMEGTSQDLGGGSAGSAFGTPGQLRLRRVQ